MLQPKRTKFRREQKNRMKGNSGRGNQLAFGSFGLKNLENCWLTAHQIAAGYLLQVCPLYLQADGGEGAFLPHHRIQQGAEAGNKP